MAGALLAAQWAADAWLAARLQSVSAGGPAVTLASSRQDFGTVAQGARLQAKFLVKNAGGRRLILHERIKDCCGGERTTPRVIVVAPGRSREVTAEVDTAPWYGQMLHVARFDTNDPQRPLLLLEVTAVVGPSGRRPAESPLRPEPDRVARLAPGP